MIRLLLLALVGVAYASTGGSTLCDNAELTHYDAWFAALCNPRISTFTTLFQNVLPMPDGKFTLLAPSNEAFEELPEGVLDLLLNDEALLSRVMALHLIPRRIMSTRDLIWNAADTALQQEDPTTWGVHSKPVPIRSFIKDGDVCIGGPNFVVPTHVNVATVIESSKPIPLSGVHHVLNHVLLPADAFFCTEHDECSDDEYCGPMDTPVTNCECPEEYPVKSLSIAFPGHCPCYKQCLDCIEAKRACDFTAAAGDYQCCQGFCTSNNECESCRPMGDECVNSNECCSAGVCDPLTNQCAQCLIEDNICTADSDCCGFRSTSDYDFHCARFPVVPSHDTKCSTCIDLHGKCDADWQCCGGYGCHSSGVCVCELAVCSSNADCCDDYVCFATRCVHRDDACGHATYNLEPVAGLAADVLNGAGEANGRPNSAPGVHVGWCYSSTGSAPFTPVWTHVDFAATSVGGLQGVADPDCTGQDFLPCYYGTPGAVTHVGFCLLDRCVPATEDTNCATATYGMRGLEDHMCFSSSYVGSCWATPAADYGEDYIPDDAASGSCEPVLPPTNTDCGFAASPVAGDLMTPRACMAGGFGFCHKHNAVAPPHCQQVFTVIGGGPLDESEGPCDVAGLAAGAFEASTSLTGFGFWGVIDPTGTPSTAPLTLCNCEDPNDASGNLGRGALCGLARVEDDRENL